MPEICIVRFDINKYSVLSRRPRMRREGVAIERQWLAICHGDEWQANLVSKFRNTPKPSALCHAPNLNRDLRGVHGHRHERHGRKHPTQAVSEGLGESDCLRFGSGRSEVTDHEL